MRAAVYRNYGPPSVVTIEDVPKPVPGDRDVLVRMVATSVTSGDARLRAFDIPKPFRLPGRLALGIFGPRNKVLGVEFAGEVEAVGRAVTKFRPGDRVFGIDVFGCHAEYKLAGEDKCITHMPDGLAYDQAPGIPFGGVTALHFFNKAKIRPGQKVLVNGASGGVGVFAVQLAKHFGAEVSGVSSAGNAELVRSLGATRVFDYASEDFSESGEQYDVIVDTVGTASYLRCEPVLKPGGVLLAVLPAPGDMFRRPRDGRRIVSGESAERPEDLRLLAELVEQGRIRPVVDRIYRLADIAEAHAYVDTHRKRGAVVVTVVA